MNDKNLEQSSGDNSTNYQARTITINKSGLSYADVREIVLDVFKENFISLKSESAEIVRVRIESMVDKYLEQLRAKQPESLQNMIDPGMQYAFYNAQKDFARTGDDQLADILIDLLLDRVRITERNLKQILIDESLKVIPMLTGSQLDILSLVFLIKHISHPDIPDKEELSKVISSEIEPFIECLPDGRSSLFQHLEYAGCAELPKGLGFNGVTKIEEIYFENYKSLFSAEFQKEDMITFLNSVGSFMPEFMDKWNRTKIKVMTLTPLGIVIAQANSRNKAGNAIDISSVFD
jgi:hypothetical protein